MDSKSPPIVVSNSEPGEATEVPASETITQLSKIPVNEDEVVNHPEEAVVVPTPKTKITLDNKHVAQQNEEATVNKEDKNSWQQNNGLKPSLVSEKNDASDDEDSFDEDGSSYSSDSSDDEPFEWPVIGDEDFVIEDSNDDEN